MTIYSVGHAIAFLSMHGWFGTGEQLKEADENLGVRETAFKKESKALETSTRARGDHTGTSPKS